MEIICEKHGRNAFFICLSANGPVCGTGYSFPLYKAKRKCKKRNENGTKIEQTAPSLGTAMLCRLVSVGLPLRVAD